jgi:putative flippase GtrA
MLAIKFIRTQLIDPKLYQYAFFGGLCALLDLALFFSLKAYFDVHYLYIATFTFIIATLLNYFLSNHFVFKKSQRFQTSMRLTLTYVVSFVGLIIHHGSLFLAFETLGFSLFLSKLFGMACAFGWNFLSRKHFVFAQT